MAWSARKCGGWMFIWVFRNKQGLKRRVFMKSEEGLFLVNLAEDEMIRSLNFA